MTTLREMLKQHLDRLQKRDAEYNKFMDSAVSVVNHLLKYKEHFSDDLLYMSNKLRKHRERGFVPCSTIYVLVYENCNLTLDSKALSLLLLSVFESKKSELEEVLFTLKCSLDPCFTEGLNIITLKEYVKTRTMTYNRPGIQLENV